MKKTLILFTCLIFLGGILPSIADNNSAPLTGKVNTSDLKNINPNMYIDVIKTLIPINSKYLSKQYSGYKITLTSRYPNSLNILGGQIIDGVSGQQAYLNVEVDCSVDTCWFPMIASKENKKAKIESYKYSNQVPAGFLNSGDSFDLYTLAPVGSAPQMKMNFVDVTNDQYFTISR
jgi:hypothetical protein